MRVNHIMPLPDNGKGPCTGPLLIGHCSICQEREGSALLTFPAIPLGCQETLRKAVLQMECVRACGTWDRVEVYINEPDTARPVTGPGCYAWDVTGLLAKMTGGPFALSVRARGRSQGCGLREFEGRDPARLPRLTLYIEDLQPIPPPCSGVDLREDFDAWDQPACSRWIDCFPLGRYDYFARNGGDGAVEISLWISPDGQAECADTGPYILAPGQTLCLTPNRLSHYIRTAFHSLGPGPQRLTLWFQGQ